MFCGEREWKVVEKKGRELPWWLEGRRKGKWGRVVIVVSHSPRVESSLKKEQILHQGLLTHCAHLLSSILLFFLALLFKTHQSMFSRTEPKRSQPLGPNATQWWYSWWSHGSRLLSCEFRVQLVKGQRSNLRTFSELAHATLSSSAGVPAVPSSSAPTSSWSNDPQSTFHVTEISWRPGSKIKCKNAPRLQPWSRSDDAWLHGSRKTRWASLYTFMIFVLSSILISFLLLLSWPQTVTLGVGQVGILFFTLDSSLDVIDPNASDYQVLLEWWILEWILLVVNQWVLWILVMVVWGLPLMLTWDQAVRECRRCQCLEAAHGSLIHHLTWTSRQRLLAVILGYVRLSRWHFRYHLTRVLLVIVLEMVLLDQEHLSCPVLKVPLVRTLLPVIGWVHLILGGIPQVLLAMECILWWSQVPTCPRYVWTQIEFLAFIDSQSLVWSWSRWSLRSWNDRSVNEWYFW